MSGSDVASSSWESTTNSETSHKNKESFAVGTIEFARAAANRAQRALAAPLNLGITIVDHRRATNQLVRLRDHFARGGPASKQLVVALTCAGINALRHATYLDAGGEDKTSTRPEDLRVTVSLIFALVAATEAVLSGESEPMDVRADADDARTTISTWKASSVDHNMRVPASAPADAASSSWEAQHGDPAVLARAALRAARPVLRESTVDGLNDLAETFFRASSALFTTKLLTADASDGDASTDFLTLDAIALIGDVVDPDASALLPRLAALVSVADSELGQGIFRDMVLSFRASRAVVGVRRSALIGRATNRLLAEQQTDAVTEAHDAAMRGASWCFEHDDCPVIRACAVLAGMAVTMLSSADEARSGDAFHGRVQLPFLETAPPEAKTDSGDAPSTFLVLLERSHEWVAYARPAATGRAVVKFRGRGFAGFCRAALVLWASE
jgi:hypothetical protein